MSIGDFLDKAKDFAGDNAEQAADLLDKAGDLIKDKAPDNIDGHVDTAVEKAKDFLADQDKA